MEANGYFKGEFPNDDENSASVVFYSPIAGGVYVATGLTNPEARRLAFSLNFNLNRTMLTVRETEVSNG